MTTTKIPVLEQHPKKPLISEEEEETLLSSKDSQGLNESIILEYQKSKEHSDFASMHMTQVDDLSLGPPPSSNFQMDDPSVRPFVVQLAELLNFGDISKFSSIEILSEVVRVVMMEFHPTLIENLPEFSKEPSRSSHTQQEQMDEIDSTTLPISVSSPIEDTVRGAKLLTLLHQKNQIHLSEQIEMLLAKVQNMYTEPIVETKRGKVGR